MPRYQITDPSGKSFEVTAPEGATQDQVLAYVKSQRAPQASTSPQAGTSAPAPSPDIFGRAKAALTDPNEAGRLWPGGPRIGPQILNGKPLRDIASYLLPGSAPEAAAQVPSMLIPGGGLAKAALRPAISAASRGTVGGLMGKDPLEEATKGGIQGLLGEGAGALLKAGSRGLQALLSKDPTKVAEIARKVIPGIGGKTTEETMSRVVGDEGKKTLSTTFKDGLDGLFKTHGDPPVVLPGLQAAGGKRFVAPASEALDEIQRMTKKALAAKDFGKIADLSRARDELMASLSKQWGKEGSAALKQLSDAYRQGSEFLRVFTGGKEQMTQARLDKLRAGGEGKLDWPTLQASFERGAGKIKEGMGPLAKQLQDALFRGEQNLGKRDIPGVAPKVGFFAGIPHLSGLPKLPVRIGAPEKASQELADLARRAAVPATGQAIE